RRSVASSPLSRPATAPMAAPISAPFWVRLMPSRSCPDGVEPAVCCPPVVWQPAIRETMSALANRVRMVLFMTGLLGDGGGPGQGCAFSPTDAAPGTAAAGGRCSADRFALLVLEDQLGQPGLA